MLAPLDTGFPAKSFTPLSTNLMVAPVGKLLAAVIVTILRLASRLAAVPITAPGIPVLHNVDVEERTSADAIRSALARQAASPVRWVETIQAFASRGVTHVVECGPGRVLAGLNKRIARDLKSFALTDGADLESAKSALAG